MQHIIDSSSALTDRIAQVAPGSFDLGEQGDVDIIRESATAVAVLAGHGEVAHVDHNHETAHEEEHGTIVLAFTSSALIIVHLKDHVTRWVITKTDVIPRTALAGIELKRVSSAIEARADRWPSTLQVQLTYDGDVPVLPLPFHTGGGWGLEGRQELAELLPSLTTDLNAHH